VNWVALAGLDAPMPAHVKIRNKHAAGARPTAPAGDPRVEVVFEEPQRA